MKQSAASAEFVVESTYATFMKKQAWVTAKIWQISNDPSGIIQILALPLGGKYSILKGNRTRKKHQSSNGSFEYSIIGWCFKNIPSVYDL